MIKPRNRYLLRAQVLVKWANYSLTIQNICESLSNLCNSVSKRYSVVIDVENIASCWLISFCNIWYVLYLGFTHVRRDYQAIRQVQGDNDQPVFYMYDTK